MPTVIEITHIDIAVFLVLLGVGLIFGFIAGRFYHTIDKLNRILTVRRRAKK